MDNTFIIIKDKDGELRPKAYLERKHLHRPEEAPKLLDGDTFVEVEITEVITHNV